MTQQTDADLIRRLTDMAASPSLSPARQDDLRRAAARLEELSQVPDDLVVAYLAGLHAPRREQPAPLALSADLAQIWATRVIQARGSVARTGIDEALLAVDALLKQRVTPLTKDDFDAWWDADALTQTNPYSEGSPVF